MDVALLISSTADGLCYIEPQLIDGANHARASEQEAAAAAFVIITKCILGRAIPRGGIARAIGKYFEERGLHQG